MNATIIHTHANGNTIRMCIRCQLVTDEFGYPDPRYYSSDFMVSYYRMAAPGRCKHERVEPKPEPSKREQELEKALSEALFTLQSVMGGPRGSENDD